MSSNLKHLTVEELQLELKGCNMFINKLNAKLHNQHQRKRWIEHYIIRRTPHHLEKLHGVPVEMALLSTKDVLDFIEESNKGGDWVDSTEKMKRYQRYYNARKEYDDMRGVTS